MGLLDGLFGGGGGGGGISSGGIGNSESKNLTTNNDGRISGGEGSSNSSQIITGGTNTLTDHSAVASSLQLALAGITGSQDLARESQRTAGSVFSGALAQASEQQAKFNDTLANVKGADVRVLIVVGLAVVGVVAFTFLRRA